MIFHKYCQDRSIVFILFNHVHMSDSACLRNIYFLRSRAYLIVSNFFSTLSKRFVRFCLAICVTLTGFFYFYILVCWVGVSLHTEMKQERYVTFCALVIYPNISWKLYLLPLLFIQTLRTKRKTTNIFFHFSVQILLSKKMKK